MTQVNMLAPGLVTATCDGAIWSAAGRSGGARGLGTRLGQVGVSPPRIMAASPSRVSVIFSRPRTYSSCRSGRLTRTTCLGPSGSVVSAIASMSTTPRAYIGSMSCAAPLASVAVVTRDGSGSRHARRPRSKPRPEQVRVPDRARFREGVSSRGCRRPRVDSSRRRSSPLRTRQ